MITNQLWMQYIRKSTRSHVSEEDINFIIQKVQENHQLILDREEVRNRLNHYKTISGGNRKKKRNEFRNKEYSGRIEKDPEEKPKIKLKLNEQKKEKKRSGRPNLEINKCKYPKKKISRILKQIQPHLQKEVESIFEYLQSQPIRNQVVENEKNNQQGIIIESLQKVVNDFSQKSKVKRSFMKQIYENTNYDINQKDFGNTFNCSQSFVSNLEKCDNNIYELKFSTEISIQKVSQEELDFLEDEWLFFNPVESGRYNSVRTDERNEPINTDPNTKVSPKQVRHVQRMTDKEIIQKLKIIWKKIFKIERSYTFFRNHKPTNIRRILYHHCMDACFCKKCFENNEKHKKDYPYQRNQYQLQEQNLKEKELILVFDFCSFYPANSENKKFGKVSDLLITKIFRNSNNEIKREYSDFLACGVVQDYNYVKSVFLYLMDQDKIFENVEKIFFWSDNGSHFKNKKTFHFFSDLSSQIGKVIEHNFFIACHGASICDSHFGIVKQVENRKKLKGDKPFNEDSYKKMIEEVNNSRGINFTDQIEEDNIKVKPIPGIRELHQICYFPNGNVWVRNLSNIGNWTKIFLKRKLTDHK
ncbi:hypothetical protein M0811_06608 [Anaeramoeba ignava]|uniref:Uncharacterized protein n=1 Tax=Anaeramoeba ignava TaxID=1746090 RepID=A0A9Q0RCT4_ANAIG|nr:hypothetical protein M0811_06608 [Anaeramoeba ignava]